MEQGIKTNSSASDPAPVRARLVDRHDVAIVLGVCAGSIDNLRRSGQLPSIKIGGRRLYDLDDVNKFIAKKKGESA